MTVQPIQTASIFREDLNVCVTLDTMESIALVSGRSKLEDHSWKITAGRSQLEDHSWISCWSPEIDELVLSLPQS